ncbi:MAG: methyltransferase domain-containing protein [Pseudomonadota bacterium]
MTDTPKTGGLAGVYDIDSADAARRYYDDWADGYDAEVSANDYVTPRRAAEALAQFVDDPTLPLADFGCGTGVSGVALAAAGFTTIDGFDISDGMLAHAKAKGVYRSLAPLDLSQPLTGFADGAYANAAAIGVISPSIMPPTVLDEILRTVPVGGAFVFSLNDNHGASGVVQGRVHELIDSGYADLLLGEKGPHLPGINLAATVYVLRRR